MIKKLLVLLLITFLISGCSLKWSENNTISQPEEQDGQEQKNEDDINKGKEEANLNEVFDIAIASIGDSLTKGIGDETQKGGYTAFLLDYLEEEQRINEIEFTHYGKKGLSSAGLLGKFKDNTIPPVIRNADAVVITIGGNDVMNIAKKNYRSLKMEQFNDGIYDYEENIHSIIKETREINPRADIYFVGLYNPWRQWFADIEEFGSIMSIWNDKTKEVAESYEDVYFVEISPLFEADDDNLIFEEDYFHPNTKGYQLMGKAVFEEIKQHSLPKLNLD